MRRRMDGPTALAAVMLLLFACFVAWIVSGPKRQPVQEVERDMQDADPLGTPEAPDAYEYEDEDSGLGDLPDWDEDAPEDSEVIETIQALQELQQYIIDEHFEPDELAALGFSGTTADRLSAIRTCYRTRTLHTSGCPCIACREHREGSAQPC